MTVITNPHHLLFQNLIADERGFEIRMLISGLDHVQITVAPEHEHAALVFYRDVLSLQEIPKPASLKKNGGAWFKLGNHELHVSPEKQPINNAESKRHICYVTDNIEAVKSHLARLGVAVIPDK